MDMIWLSPASPRDYRATVNIWFDAVPVYDLLFPTNLFENVRQLLDDSTWITAIAEPDLDLNDGLYRVMRLYWDQESRRIPLRAATRSPVCVSVKLTDRGDMAQSHCSLKHNSRVLVCSKSADRF